MPSFGFLFYSRNAFHSITLCSETFLKTLNDTCLVSALLAFEFSNALLFFVPQSTFILFFEGCCKKVVLIVQQSCPESIVRYRVVS